MRRADKRTEHRFLRLHHTGNVVVLERDSYDVHLTPQEARRFAQMLRRAADRAEEWENGVTSPASTE